MKAFILVDGDDHTAIYRELYALVNDYLNKNGFETETREVCRDDLKFCMGCFGCWIKKPGECVIEDGMADINRASMNSDVFVYLTPIVFGQFSTNIKTALERWLPNMLPYFHIRPDGSTMHPARYENNPHTLVIGCGQNLSQEDAELFADITKKHRRNADVVIHTGSAESTLAALRAIKLAKVGAQL